MSTLNVKQINEAYFNACNFETLMRGIHFAVFCSALSKIYTGSRRHRGRSQLLMTLLVVTFFIMSTIDNANYWAYVRSAFIAHGETAKSIAEALDSYPTWYIGLTSVSDANAVLADSAMIWRCWIIWGRRWIIIVPPIITTMLMAAFSIIAVYRAIFSTSFNAKGPDYATALYSATLLTTLYCTSMIIYRI
ncbi:hypothetical protein C8J56DRAFT_363188 [Mycena floridula]|nr:hypothetical protein C8J56DRAFT_363188 [Mycena floridula]